jgi:hypothetical protein
MIVFKYKLPSTAMHVPMRPGKIIHTINEVGRAVMSYYRSAPDEDMVELCKMIGTEGETLADLMEAVRVLVAERDRCRQMHEEAESKLQAINTKFTALRYEMDQIARTFPGHSG